MGQSFFAAKEPFVLGLAGPAMDSGMKRTVRTDLEHSGTAQSSADHPEDDRALAAMLGAAAVAGLGFWIGLFVVIF